MGGVAFNEDVNINGAQWMPFGKQEANTIPTGMQEFGHFQSYQVDRRAFRFTTGLEFTVPGLDGWQGNADYVYSTYDKRRQRLAAI